MSNETKISPAFEPFLADIDEDDKRDAIVIYEAPQTEYLLPRSRLLEIEKRLDQVRLMFVARSQAEKQQKASLLALQVKLICW